MDIDVVRAAAETIRRAFEELPASSLPGTFSIMFANFPRGACGDASLILAMYLEEKFGLNDFDYVSGARGSEPWWARIFRLVIAYVSGERGSESDETRRGHGWLQRGNLFVDITADQFKDAPGKVIVEVNSKWHGTFEVNRPISPEVIKSWTGPGTGYPPLYDQVMRHVVNS